MYKHFGGEGPPTSTSFNTRGTPQVKITPIPQIPQLEKRKQETTLFLAPDNTCGFVDGIEYRYYTCINTRNRCQFYRASGDSSAWQACCNGYLDCSPHTTCLDKTNIPTTSVDSAVTLVCSSSDHPVCGTYRYDLLGAQGFGCLPATGYRTSVSALTDFIGGNGRVFISTVLFASSSSTLDTPTGTSDTPITSATPTNQPAPVGAIVGGVIGGVAVIAITVLAILWVIYTSRRRDSKVPGGRPISEQPVITPTASPPVEGITAGNMGQRADLNYVSPFLPQHTNQSPRLMQQAPVYSELPAPPIKPVVRQQGGTLGY